VNDIPEPFCGRQERESITWLGYPADFEIQKLIKILVNAIK